MPVEVLTTSWIDKIKDLALETPFGHPVKITVGVTPQTGRLLARHARNRSR